MNASAKPVARPAGEISVGDQVQKVKGYPFPGEVRAVFTTTSGNTRFVVECTVPGVSGCLHIFNGEQIRRIAADA